MQNDNSGAKKEDYFFGPKNLRDSNLLYSNSPLSQPYRSPFTQPFSSPSSSGGKYRISLSTDVHIYSDNQEIVLWI